MFLTLENESRSSRDIRYAKYVLSVEVPRGVRKAIRRDKLTGFDISLPPSMHFGIQSEEDYHKQYCETMNFCPVTNRYFESQFNYCPYCGLNLLKIRARQVG